MSFVKRNIHCALVITSGKVDHDPMWDYPLEAVRETLANALCHRDYGAPYDIQVKIFEDSLCISSPGQLPFDMPMDFLMKPTHPSRPRNKLIAQVFFDMGIIELILRGGWPGTLEMPFKYAIKTPAERDLRTYAESLGAELYHYQDYENHEIDAVVELSDGRWAAIEVKLGVNQEESAAAGLKKIAAQMSAGGCAPSALIIVVGLASAAYRRKDGVYVVPITALKP